MELDNIKIADTDLSGINSILTGYLTGNNKSMHIITFNTDFYYNASINPEFKTICQESDLVVPDGFGITFLLKTKYKKNINRITGNDIFKILLDISNKKKFKIAFIGSSENVQQKLREKILQSYPSVDIVHSSSPLPNFEYNYAKNEELVKELESVKPDIVLVALGSPRQELWINKIKDRVGAYIYMGVGAVFDFYTGERKRSPLFLQKLRLEWLWRLLNEPRRLFNRYLINDLPFILKQYFRIKLGRE